MAIAARGIRLAYVDSRGGALGLSSGGAIDVVVADARQSVKYRTTREGLRLLRPSAKAVLVDPEGTNFRFERRPRNTKPCRGARRSVHPAAAGAKGVFDASLLLRAVR
jgi:hypothetical protein